MSEKKTRQDNAFVELDKDAAETAKSFEQDGLRSKKGFLGVPLWMWIVAAVIAYVIKGDEIKEILNNFAG